MVNDIKKQKMIKWHYFQYFSKKISDSEISLNTNLIMFELDLSYWKRETWKDAPLKKQV